MPPAEPADIRRQETLAFVARALGGPGRRVLDVGCGEGALALELQRAGHTVTAIDGRAEAVAAAQAKGVDARQADFLTFEGGPFDALVFAFSLHHMEPLPAALARARDLLAPGGRLILMEVAFDRVDRATALFFQGMRDVLLAAGALSGPEVSGALEPGADPLALWHEMRADAYARYLEGGTHHHHGHGHSQDALHGAAHTEPDELHGSAAMRAELAKGFRFLHEEEGPGLYSFMLEDLHLDQGETARRLLALERGLVAAGAIRAVGVRWVATPR